MSKLRIGDRVRAIDAPKLNDLRGCEGEILERDGRWMLVCFDRVGELVVKWKTWIHGNDVRGIK